MERIAIEAQIATPPLVRLLVARLTQGPLDRRRSGRDGSIRIQRTERVHGYPRGD